MRRVLVDECPPVQLHRGRDGFDARTVEFMGWKGKADSELLEAAQGHFDVLLTSGSFMKRHHDLGQGLAIVLVTTNRLREVEQLVPEIADALAAVSPGERLHVPLPTRAAHE